MSTKRKRDKIPEITPEMMDAGMDRYCNLTGEVDREYLVSEVFLAMRRAERAISNLD